MEAASTFAWGCSSRRTQRSGELGSVPAAMPAAYQSDEFVQAHARAAPAMRNPASRNVRAKPSSPSTARP